MEETPRCVDLTGDAIDAAAHAFGANGVITEVTLPLAPTYDWIEMLVSYPTWSQALEAGWTVTHHEGLWLKELAAVEAPAPYQYFARYRKFLERGDNLLCILAAPNAIVALSDKLKRQGGRIAYQSDQLSDTDRKGLTRLHHLTWNHTTLQARRVDPEITYLQVGIPVDRLLKTLDAIRQFPGNSSATSSSSELRDGSTPHCRCFTTRMLSACLRSRYGSKPRAAPTTSLLRLEEGMPATWSRQLQMKKDHDPRVCLTQAR